MYDQVVLLIHYKNPWLKLIARLDHGTDLILQETDNLPCSNHFWKHDRATNLPSYDLGWVGTTSLLVSLGVWRTFSVSILGL